MLNNDEILTHRLNKLFIKEAKLVMGEQQTAGIFHYGDTHVEKQCQIRTRCLTYTLNVS